MTTVDLKTEIQKVLEDIPENVLPEILEYIKQVQFQSHKKIIDKIIAEEWQLFQRLADS